MYSPYRVNSISAQKPDQIEFELSLQMVQSSELASVRDIWLNTGHLSAHRERRHVLLREEGAHAEAGVAETQKYTRRESLAGA